MLVPWRFGKYLSHTCPWVGASARLLYPGVCPVGIEKPWSRSLWPASWSAIHWLPRSLPRFLYRGPHQQSGEPVRQGRAGELRAKRPYRSIANWHPLLPWSTCFSTIQKPRAARSSPWRCQGYRGTPRLSAAMRPRVMTTSPNPFETFVNEFGAKLKVPAHERRETS